MIIYIYDACRVVATRAAESSRRAPPHLEADDGFDMAVRWRSHGARRRTSMQMSGSQTFASARGSSVTRSSRFSVAVSEMYLTPRWRRDVTAVVARTPSEATRSSERGRAAAAAQGGKW
jgi:hypothetical protein